MKIFVDTANLDEIKAALDTGFVDGVTTNPSLLAKEPKGKFEEHIGKILDILRSYHNREGGLQVYGPQDCRHLSVEVFSRDPDEIVEQATHFPKIFKYPVSVKVQVGWKELEIIRRLAAEKISVNCTACMTVSQAVWAAKAGAKYASLFWGRIRDASPDVITSKLNKLKNNSEQWNVLKQQLDESNRILQEGILTKEDFDPVSVVRRTREIFDREQFDCEIIAGSMRSVWDVRDAMLAGAHIVTVPYKYFSEFPKMVQHFKTDEVVQQFLTDFENWLR